MDIAKLQDLLAEVEEARDANALTEESIAIFNGRLEDIDDEPLNLIIQITDILEVATEDDGSIAAEVKPKKKNGKR